MVLGSKLMLAWIWVFAFVTIVNSEATWSEWRPLGVCTARPCNCHPVKKGEKCDVDSVLEIRFCNRSRDDPPCEYGMGPIRVNDKCVNDGVNCPGWSEWRDIGLPCNCVDDNKYGMIIKKRVCDNPPHMYKSVKCFDENDGNLDGTEQKEWQRDERCTCEVTTVPTTAPSVAPPTTNPACNETSDGYEEDYPAFEDDESPPDDENSKPPECEFYYDGY